MDSTQSNRLIRVEEVAAALNVPKSWVYKQAEQGRLPHYKVGRYLRFDLAAVLASLQGNQ